MPINRLTGAILHADTHELARKHCGSKRSFRIRLEVLCKKCGSFAGVREFRRTIKNIVDADDHHDHFPDYSIRLDDNDMVWFTNKGSMDQKIEADVIVTILDAEVYAEARLAAPGWDVYLLEQEWRAWVINSDRAAPKNPELAFIGFCRQWASRQS